MADHDETDVDWKGLLTIGSLIGNVLQYSDKTTLQNSLLWTEERLRAIADDRERVLAGLQQLQRAYGVLKRDAERIMAHNNELLGKLTKSALENERLRIEVAELTAALQTLEKRKATDAG